MKGHQDEDLFVDIGTESREETLALGVQIGDYMSYHRQGSVLNDGKYLHGKSCG
jgi:endoglucanase